MSPHTQTRPFARDSFTWLAYLLQACFTYLQAILGPLIPYLRAELRLSYTLAGLHLSAFAVGMLVAGLVGEPAMRVHGRRALFWGGTAGMLIGSLLLATASHVLMTLFSALCMGTGGAVMLVTGQAALSDHHGELRAVAFAEASVVGGVSAGLSPVLVGGLEAIDLSWRGSLLFAAGVLALLIAGFRGEPVPAGTHATSAAAQPRAGLPATYWAYWFVILLSVAIEFSIIGWGAEFLDTTIGLETNTAATAMGVFFLAMVCGRFAGSRLARRFDARTLLLGAILVVAAGFPLFWLPRSPLASVSGLLIAGLGVGNLFPLTIALALGAAHPHTNVASARVTLGAGLAVLGAPLLLGAVADQVGIAAAYAAALAFILAALIAVVFANNLARRRVFPDAPSV